MKQITNFRSYLYNQLVRTKYILYFYSIFDLRRHNSLQAARQKLFIVEFTIDSNLFLVFNFSTLLLQGDDVTPTAQNKIIPD